MNELLNMTIEELSELIQACCKYKRWLNGDRTLRTSGEIIVENLQDEIVDVYNVVFQLRDKLFVSDTDFYSKLGVKMYRTECLKNK